MAVCNVSGHGRLLPIRWYLCQTLEETCPYYDMEDMRIDARCDPIDGTIGTVLTINGSGFGDRKGKVLINGIPGKDSERRLGAPPE